MLEHGGEGFEALACGVGALEIIHAYHGGLDAGDAEPGVGLAIIAVDDFECDGFSNVILEIKLDLFGDVGARWEGAGDDLACLGFAEVNDVFGVRLGFRRTAMAVDPESKLGRRGEGDRLQRASAAFFITAAFGNALQDGGLGAIAELARLNGPFCVAESCPAGCWLGGGRIEKPRGEFLCPGEEFGRRRRAALGYAFRDGLDGGDLL